MTNRSPRPTTRSWAEPCKVTRVAPLKTLTAEQRREAIRAAGRD